MASEDSVDFVSHLESTCSRSTVFPAGCLHQPDSYCSWRDPRASTGLDSQGFQHIASFCNGLRYIVDRYSYGRRLPGLSFSALRPKPLTPPRNLPAPGRRQPLYVVFRLSRGLCFW